MVKINTIASNVFVAGGGRVIGGLFAFGSIVLITRVLGPQKFGEYSTVLAFLYIFNALADFGLYAYLIREIARRNDSEKEIIGHVLSLRMAILVLSLAAGIIIGHQIPYDHAIKNGFFVCAISYFFLSSSQVLMGVFQKYLVIWQVACAEITSRFIQLALFVYLFLNKDSSVMLFLYALALASFTNFVLTWWFATRHVKFILSIDIHRWGEIIKESLPIALALIFTLIYFRLDTVLLSLFKPAEDVGIYNIAYKLLENIIFYPSMLVGLIMPILSKEAFVNPERFKTVFQRTVKILFIGALPMLVGGWLLAPEIVGLLGGKLFIDAAAPFKILLAATFFIFFGTLLGAAVIALGKQKEAIPVYFGAMLFNVTANLLFIPKFSYMATSITTLLTEFFVVAGLVFLVRKTVVWPQKLFVIKVFVAAVIMGGLIFVLRDATKSTPSIYTLAIFIPLSFLIYGLSLLVLRALNREEIKFFFGKAE